MPWCKITVDVKVLFHVHFLCKKKIKNQGAECPLDDRPWKQKPSPFKKGLSASSVRMYAQRGS